MASDDDRNIYNTVIKQGSTFSRTIIYKDSTEAVINLSGYTARAHLCRKLVDVDPVLTLTTENGGLTITGAEGKIVMLITAAQTALMDGSYVYDLELVNGAEVNRILQGTMTVDLQVTK